MKKMKKTTFQVVQRAKRILSLCLFAICITLVSCSKKEDDTLPAPIAEKIESEAKVVIDSMGTGFNLGNTFDRVLNSTDPATIYPIIDLYYNAGLRHIRIPVTWIDTHEFSGNTLASANGTVNFNHPRFIQLKAVIDYAMKKKMYVVLNTHHEKWLYDNYDGSAQYDTAFRNLWTNIATYFKGYSHRLIFDVLNEPQRRFGSWDNNPVSVNNAGALDLTRKINRIGWEAIRATGEYNTKRIVMISTNGGGNHVQLRNVYPNLAAVPGTGTDKYIAFHVHSYDPWEFCGETGNNSAYRGSAWIISELTRASTHAKSLDIPVNYGEFGVGRFNSTVAQRNTDVVREYYKTMRTTCMNEKMAATVWDERGWFALVGNNAATGPYFLYNIVPNMMAP
jgi:endoglucanase